MQKNNPLTSGADVVVFTLILIFCQIIIYGFIVIPKIHTVKQAYYSVRISWMGPFFKNGGWGEVGSGFGKLIREGYPPFFEYKNS